MRPNLFRSAAIALAGLCLSIGFAVPTGPANADIVQTAENLIDSTNSLPFKFADWKPILDNCTGDDMVACADMVAQSQMAQDSGEPYWIPKMIDVYFDVRNKDYWGVAEDGGEAAACAVAQLFTEIDICGAIKTLENAASAVYSGAEAAVQFLADLGSDIAGAVKDLGCDLGFGGCDSPTPPSQAQLAQVFLTSMIPQGLSARQTGSDAWASFYDAVVGKGTAQGISANELYARKQWFKDTVYQQWDSWIFSSVLPNVNKAKGQFTPNAAGNYVAIGMQHAGEIDPLAYPTFDGGLLPVYQPGRDACANAMANSGAQAVSTWLWEGRPPASSGIPAPPNPNTACAAFDDQLKALLTAALASSVKANVSKYCTYHGAPEYVYICPKYSNATFRCKAAMTLLGDSTQCIEYNPGPTKLPYICPPDNHIEQHFVTDPPSVLHGCKPAQLNNLPPGTSGGSSGPGNQY